MAIALPAHLPAVPTTDPSAGAAGAVGRLAQAASPASVGSSGAIPSTQEGLLRRALPTQGQVERFQAALGKDDLAGPQDLGPDAPDVAGAADAADAAAGQGAGQRQGSSRNVGDSILRGLGALSRDLTRVWNDVRGQGLALHAAEPLTASGKEVAEAQSSTGASDSASNSSSNSASNSASTQVVPLQPEAANPSRVGDLLAMQRSMVEFSFLFDAVGKGTSKAIDGTNQLVKMQ